MFESELLPDMRQRKKTRHGNKEIDKPEVISKHSSVSVQRGVKTRPNLSDTPPALSLFITTPHVHTHTHSSPPITTNQESRSIPKRN